MFKQGDPAWGNKKLGASGLSMKNFGCVVTNVAQALKNRGHDVDPGVLVDKLNKVGGFTKGGLLIWNKVTEVYPAFKFGDGDVEFVQGVYSRYNHWVLRMNGKVSDPLFGRDRAPKGFRETGRVRKASIKAAKKAEKKPEPVKKAPKETPKEEPKEAEKPGVYVVKEGDNLTHIVKRELGIENDRDAYLKALDIAAANGISNPDLIHPGQEIKLD